MAEAVDAALDGLRVLEHHARQVARAFRDDRIREGRDRLADLVETTQTMLRLAVVTAEACGRDLDQVCRSEGLNLDVDTRVAVDHMIEHQLGAAWPQLATVLDEEFSPVLGQWRTVFERLAPGRGPEPGGRAA